MWGLIDRLFSCLIFLGLVVYALWIIALEYSHWCGVVA
jgi:hypothetical protein